MIAASHLQPVEHMCTHVYLFTSIMCIICYCSAWLRGDDDLVISRINNRIGAVTGLDMNTAEDLQVYLTFNNIWVISSCLLLVFLYAQNYIGG